MNATTGISSNRGGVVFSAGFYKQQDVFSSGRDWANVPFAYDWETGEVSITGSSAIPEGRIGTVCPSTLKCEGNQFYKDLVAKYPMVSNFTRDATTGEWRPYSDAGSSDTGQGDLYNYAPVNYLVTPQQRYHVFSSGDFDFSDNIRGYFEASYVNRRSDQLLASEPILTVDPPAPNPVIVVSADSIYNPFGRDLIDVRRRVLETGGRHFTQDIDTFRTVLGVDGPIPGTDKKWTWDLNFNFGRSANAGTIDGEMIISRMRSALGPSYRDASGQAFCGTPDNTIGGCVPLDLLSGGIPGTITPEMLNYVSYTGVVRGFNEQKILSGNVAGKLFDMPSGGPVSLAVGGQFEREDGKYQPDPFQASGDNLDGSASPTGGGYNVVSGFLELNATLLQNMTAVDKLELTGAVRAGRYNTFGGFATWKGGARWQIVKDLAVRGTASSAFRAPNVLDLYRGVETSFPTTSDPCDTSAARTPLADAQCKREGVPDNFTDDRLQLPEELGGNTELEPEKALTFTGGAVFTPRFLKGFSVTLDYFNIDIDQAITAEGATVILTNCYNSDVPADCDKIVRDPVTHFVSSIRTST